MKRSELRTFIRLLVSDPNGTRYTNDQIHDAIAIVEKQFALDSKSLFKDKTYTLSGGDVTKDLPTDFMWEKKVTLDGLKLDPISREQIERIKRSDDWTDDEGTPTWFIIDPEEAAKTIRPYPSYPSGKDDKTMILTYYFRPAVMTQDTDTPFNGYTLFEQFHHALGYGVADLLLGYETATAELVSRRSDLRVKYEIGVEDARNTFDNSVSEPIQMRGGRGGKRAN